MNGLTNAGNFCYIISAIQGLRIILQDFFIHNSPIIDTYFEITSKFNFFRNPDEFVNSFDSFLEENDNLVREIIIKNNKKYNCEITYDFIIDKIRNNQLKICSLLLLKTILVEMMKNDDVVDTNNFIKIFSLCVRKNGLSYICNGEQNDSNEFIIILLDYLNDCVSMKKNCILENNKILELKEEDLNNIEINNRVKIQMQLYYFNTFSKEYSYFHHSLNTLILNIVKCVKCNFSQSSINTANNLCCPIPKKKNITIYDCLDEYFRPEKIEYKCDKCKETNENIIIKKILDCKKYLIISLKKFDYNFELNILTKKHEHTAYPLNLNLNAYTMNNTFNNYRLKSVINHIGMLNYGHYYSDVFYENDWYNCNDEIVTKYENNGVANEEENNDITLMKTDNKNAYILIYEKI